MDEDFDLQTGEDELMNEDAMGISDDTPALKVGEEEIGKQGLKKKLIKEGEGWENPEVGDEVEVHYTGTLLNGTQFHSSRNRGSPFKFKLGQALGSMLNSEDAVGNKYEISEEVGSDESFEEDSENEIERKQDIDNGVESERTSASRGIMG